MTKNTYNVTLANGDVFVAKPTLEDTLAFETTLRRNPKWGGLKDSVLKMQPYRSWNYLTRTGAIDLTWEEFTSGDTAAIDVSTPDEEDDELEVPGLGKDSRKARSTTSPSPSPSEPASPQGSGSPSATE